MKKKKRKGKEKAEVEGEELLKRYKKTLKKGKEYRVLLKSNHALQGIYKGVKKGLLVFQNPYFADEISVVDPTGIDGFIEESIFPSCIDWERVNEILFNDEEFKDIEEEEKG
jgi:hypothetical protein